MKYQLISTLREHQIDQLLSLYKKEFWCNKRVKEDVEKMLKNSDIIVALEDEGQKLIAFSRLLSDFTYKATLYDVIVDSSYRGEKLGKKLMNAIFSHPDLKTIEQIELYCLPEMVSFYNRWGFTCELGELTLMRSSPNIVSEK